MNAVLTNDRRQAIVKGLDAEFGETRSCQVLGAAMADEDLFEQICLADTDSEAVEAIIAWW